MIKKPDIILIILLLVFACSFIFMFDLTDSGGENVMITLDGSIYGIYPLNDDCIIDIADENDVIINTLKIKNLEARMIYATCPDKHCIGQGAAARSHDTIVCLPNRIVVEISGGAENEVDAVVQ